MANDARSAVAVVNQKFMAAFEAGDAAGIAAQYTADGQILPPQSETLSGLAAIEAFWQGAMGMGIKQAKLETVEFEEQGDRAYEIGKYTLFAEGGEPVDTGKFLVLWKNDGGTWKLHRDIWNSSRT